MHINIKYSVKYRSYFEIFSTISKSHLDCYFDGNWNLCCCCPLGTRVGLLIRILSCERGCDADFLLPRSGPQGLVAAA